MAERILLVEDDRELREFLAEVLEGAGYAVSAHASAGRALAELSSSSAIDLIITDLMMPGMDGGQLLAEARLRRAEINVIVMTAFGTIESAIELTRAGAWDYLTKPFGADELLLSVDRALRESRLRRDVARLANDPEPPPGFVGSSPPMQELYRTIRRVAASRLSALITGETGTGKELVATAIHSLSGRRHFVAVNCAALPEQLLESELFGHTKGAFTGADRDKPGLFEAADGGTLFLDEVGDLPKALQPKMLRTLEGGEVRRLGSSITKRVDVRVIAATNRDLDAAMLEGAFREDLFWRLSVVPLRVPALRDRPEDVLPLVDHFLREFNASGSTAITEIAPAALALLASYPWPGNVRELRNVVERAAALAAGPRVEAADLPNRIRRTAAVASRLADAKERRVSLRELERGYILEVVRETEGNRSQAAEILGLDRKTLYRKLQEYDRGAGE